jgi:glycyl-tRNA synthetase
MDILGPEYKDHAAAIKSIIEDIDVAEKMGDLSINYEGKNLNISKDAYDIVESKEKELGEKFIPHVIEPSYGIDRILYCILEHNYKEIEKENESYHLLSLPYEVAPIKTGVFPLIKDDSLISISETIDNDLRDCGVSTSYDESGTIGRRYARMDEIGTPFCITVDHETIDNKTVTIRYRDTTKQKRINIDDLPEFFQKQQTLV